MTRQIAAALDSYADLLERHGHAFPAANLTHAMKRTIVRPVLLIELVCFFAHEHIPDYPVESSLLLNGYERVNGVPSDAAARRHYAVLRLLAVTIVGSASHSAAVDAHRAFDPRLRAFEITQGKAAASPWTPQAIPDFLRETLDTAPMFEAGKVEIAEIGTDHVVRLAGARSEPVLAKVAIPEIPGLYQDIADRDRLFRSAATSTPRTPIRIEDGEIEAACAAVDGRERDPRWSRTLPPLNLFDRWREVSVKSMPGQQFRNNGGYTLDGMNHVVGILSARKTTFAWALTFSVLAKHPGKRILVFAKDVVTAATMDARLRAHGIRSTLLSSARQRDKHLRSVHKHVAYTQGTTLAQEGDFTGRLPTACALLGMQDERPSVAQGRTAQAEWPDLARLPSAFCNGLDPPSRGGTGKRCPFWGKCAVHIQQTSIPTAQVIVATPASFLLTRPDAWIGTPIEEKGPVDPARWRSERPMWLELTQSYFDLVLVDEADAIMRWFDDTFTRDVPLLKLGLDNWAAVRRQATLSGLGNRSGAPFRDRVNAQYVDTESRLTNALARLYHLIEGETNAWLKHILSRRVVTGTSLMVEFFWAGRSDDEITAMHKSGITELAVISSVSTLMDALAAFSQPESFRDEFSKRQKSVFDRTTPDAAVKALTYAVPEIGAAREILHLAALDLRDDIDLIDNIVSGELAPALDHVLKPFAWRRRPGAAKLYKMPQTDVARRRANVQDILFAVFAEDLLRTFATHVTLSDAASDDFSVAGATDTLVGGQTLRRYLGLLPASAWTTTFGLRYERNDSEDASLGGSISVLSNYAPGRAALLSLHNARAAEGQLGPAVVLLSGTSWSGGSIRDVRRVPDGHGGDEEITVDAAAPIFDIQAPVAAVLEPPVSEVAQLSKSIVRFEPVLVNEKEDGKSILRQVRMSGAQGVEKAHAIEAISRSLSGIGRSGGTSFDANWVAAETAWGEDLMRGRRRALCVANSYADAARFADALAANLRDADRRSWQVFAAVPDDDERPSHRPRAATALPRSLMEDFGNTPEYSVLVAPMSVVDRGHNIVTRVEGSDGVRRFRAAISSVYFLHRSHPRPDDLDPVIARINRLAVRVLQEGIDETDPTLRRFAKLVANEPSDALRRNRILRSAARHLYQIATAWRFGYSSLREEEQAQFGWNWLTSFWQTTGRLIRGGVPAQVILVDRAFAPKYFGGFAGAGKDTKETSVILRALFELEQAFQREPEVARRLYGPLHDLLRKAAEQITRERDE